LTSALGIEIQYGCAAGQKCTIDSGIQCTILERSGNVGIYEVHVVGIRMGRSNESMEGHKKQAVILSRIT